MQAPWQPQLFPASSISSTAQPRYRLNQSNSRGSLRQVIERSTSAPPSTSDPTDDSLVGNDLLEHIARGLNDASISMEAVTPLSENRSRLYSGKDLSILETVDNSGRATAPTTLVRLLPPGFEETANSYRESRDTPSRHHNNSHTCTLSENGLFRSHSATHLLSVHEQQQQQRRSSPAVVQPPPGLLARPPIGTPPIDPGPSFGAPSLQQSLNIRAPQQQQQQHEAIAASTTTKSEVLRPRPSALRPAAKTLMDLIQEDRSSEDLGHRFDVGDDHHHVEIEHQHRNHAHHQPAASSSSSSPGRQSLQGIYHRVTNSPASSSSEFRQQGSDDTTITGTTHHYHHNQISNKASLLRNYETTDGISFGGGQHRPNSLVSGSGDVGSLMHHMPHDMCPSFNYSPSSRMNQNAAVSMYACTSGPNFSASQDTAGHQPSSPYAGSATTATTRLNHDVGSGAVSTFGATTRGGPQSNHGGPSSSDIRLTSSTSFGSIHSSEMRNVAAYASLQQQQHQHNILSQQHPVQQQALLVPQQQQGRQDVFFTGQQRVDVGAPGLQAQVLPSGQTLYINGPSPATGFGFATVQYHGQQAPIIHHQTVAGSSGNDPYVSVLPIQSSSHPQIAYWTPDVPTTAQAMRTAVTIVGPPAPSSQATASAQIPMTSVRSVPSQPDSPHGESSFGGKTKEKGSSRGRRGQNSRRGGDKASAHASASPLLEEFRTSKNREWNIYQIEGHVVEFCQDQNGSRFIQQRLEVGSPQEQTIVIKEVLPAIRRLRNDVFGNYVVQKLLEFGSPAMKSDIRETLKGEMLQLSLQMYGCRVVQKALEALDENDLPRLLIEFHHNVLSCIHDQNGNHVIQKCVEVLSLRAKTAAATGDSIRAGYLWEQIDFIIDDVLANATSLSCHPYGCRVLQRILEHCNEYKKALVLDEIKRSHQKLLDDQYGNYVIQHVLQYGRPSDRDSLLFIIVENGLLRLSRQKFASNVVEKLLKYGNGTQRCAIVREMLRKTELDMGTSEGGRSVVLHMVRDAYANYVVQTTLDVVPESEEKRNLLHELNVHAEELKNYTFAKHIIAKLGA